MKHINRISYSFLRFLFLFIAFHGAFYIFILRFNQLVPFQKKSYHENFHHYVPDGRVEGNRFDLLRALGQSDAQWYLKIANDGYSHSPEIIEINDKKTMEGLTYAFFPLYPISLALINRFVGNIELAAFIFSHFLLVVNFISLYFVISRLFNPSLAYKTIFLLFLFPFSIFYRSYFTEGLLLFFLIWFSWFVIQKQWIRAAVVLGLMNVVKSNGLLLNGYLLYLLIQEFRHHRLSKRNLSIAVILALVPIGIWMAYCFMQTGNPVYFASVRAEWNSYVNPLLTLNANGVMIFLFPLLPFHGFHYSKIDTLTMAVGLVILWKSRTSLDKRLWWIALCLWLAPLLTTDTMSFTRYQSISFPLFLYAADKLNPRQYGGVVVISGFLLCVVSLLFVNWYWIG